MHHQRASLSSLALAVGEVDYLALEVWEVDYLTPPELTDNEGYCDKRVGVTTSMMVGRLLRPVEEKTERANPRSRRAEIRR